MLEAAVLIPFAFAVIALAASPGPDLALLIGRGIGQGRNAAFFTAVGILLAGMIQVPLLALGFGSVIASSATAFDIVRLAGAGYLAWRGMKLLFGKRQGSDAASSTKTTAFAAARDGVVASLSNPKGLIFMLAFLPQFVVPHHGPVARQILILGITMKLVAFAVEGGIAIVAGALGGWIARHPRLMRWQERLTGGFMIALGLRLAFAGDTRSS